MKMNPAPTGWLQIPGQMRMGHGKRLNLTQRTPNQIDLKAAGQDFGAIRIAYPVGKCGWMVNLENGSQPILFYGGVDVGLVTTRSFSASNPPLLPWNCFGRVRMALVGYG